ncbi:EF-hand domain-containing protein [Umezawaea sp. Da 62-37]|uniref:EF-hand domain-containing protein n=1 Tax=Umezawaea sp. Da 62-37 TaxID=3075927 RepID=UPI0028F72216|nr:EF-hand domain-containing protein [Umezawaea sp. Da 62-37]WNV86513.1 EF-hand domain-containing protein [Umezawaea sp. Da 62-37]
MNEIHTVPEPAATGALPFGPDSITWQYIGQWRLVTVLARALVLETAHPVVGAGVTQFSTYRGHPWRRAKQTMLSLQRIVYLDTRGREKEAARLTRLHSRINGVDASGCPFDALDPEAVAWVHLTLFEAVVTMCRAGGDPLSPEDESRLYDEMRTCGALLGLGDDDLPATVADFWVYFEKMTSQRLTLTQGLVDLLAALAGDIPPPSRLAFLPAPVWRVLSGTAADAYMRMTAALLPEELRERFGMHAGTTGTALATVVCRGARLLDRITPQRLRFMPVAAAAIEAERRLSSSLRRAAATPAAGRPEIFERILDQSGDGYVSWSDLAATARVIAARLEVDEATESALYDAFHAWWLDLQAGADVDGDGRVDRHEYERAAHGKALRTAMDAVAAALDSDGDGYVDQAEYTRLLGDRVGGDEVLGGFRQLDSDGDGRLTVEEFAIGLGGFFAGRSDSSAGMHLLGRT